MHDRAQQRLVSLGLELRAAQASVPPQLDELKDDLSHVAEGLASVFDELRDISQGIHPAIATPPCGWRSAMTGSGEPTPATDRDSLHAARRDTRVEVA